MTEELQVAIAYPDDSLCVTRGQLKDVWDDILRDVLEGQHESLKYRFLSECKVEFSSRAFLFRRKLNRTRFNKFSTKMLRWAKRKFGDDVMSSLGYQMALVQRKLYGAVEAIRDDERVL